MRVLATAGLAASALVLAACGLGTGAERGGSGATLRVTRDFGQRLLSSAREPKVRADQTVMRFLGDNNRVKTRFGGRFVQSIDGLAGRGASGGADWFFYVNGLESDRGAADVTLSPGDVVQWDWRNWRTTMDVRAIVGAFPEPFRHGRGGKRMPARVECGDSVAAQCARVKSALSAVGAKPAGSVLGAPASRDVIRVVVATWREASVLRTARMLAQGPRRSGIFARFSADGLDLLSPDGRTRERAPAGTGIVAALRPTPEEFVWLVTGLDGAAVTRAAAALNARDLRDAFAVAASPRGVRALPLGAAR